MGDTVILNFFLNQRPKRLEKAKSFVVLVT